MVYHSKKTTKIHQQNLFFPECSPNVKTLIQTAHDIRKRAYCPYSQFHVGAAVLCQDGTIFTGNSFIFGFVLKY